MTREKWPCIFLLSRLHRLYEQRKTAPEGAVILGDYLPSWLRWTHAGFFREIDCSGLPLLTSAGQCHPGDACHYQA
jgi:hypothetical protein